MGTKEQINVTRPTYIHIDVAALLHNIKRVKQCAPGKKIIAMVKANAYGCGLSTVVPVLEGEVDVFGVACIEEAMSIRALGSRADCMLAQGVFSVEELKLAAIQHFQCVIHQPQQLQWVLANPLDTTIKVWVKVDTGMHRLGLSPHEVADVLRCLQDCPWVDNEIGLMTHLACGDEVDNPYNDQQLQCFNQLAIPTANILRSMANSAAILALHNMHFDVVRPGIMLYGVSPFANQTGAEYGLLPVMHFRSAVSTIHHFDPHARIGYGGIWHIDKPSIIGVVPVGYGDGYPRHISANTPTSVNGMIAPIVGRVSMDMLTINLTDCPGVKVGDPVELWGMDIPVEIIAKSAGTIGYELLCQVTTRTRG